MDRTSSDTGSEQETTAKPSADAFTKYRDSICLTGTHSSLHPLLIHRLDKHTFPDSTPTQTHPNERALWTQILESEFQMPSGVFFPECSLNKDLPCPCISFQLISHPVEAPLSTPHSQHAKGRQILCRVFLSVAELVVLPVLRACQDEGFPCTSPPRVACSRSTSHLA